MRASDMPPTVQSLAVQHVLAGPKALGLDELPNEIKDYGVDKVGSSGSGTCNAVGFHYVDVHNFV